MTDQEREAVREMIRTSQHRCDRYGWVPSIQDVTLKTLLDETDRLRDALAAYHYVVEEMGKEGVTLNVGLGLIVAAAYDKACKALGVRPKEKS